MSRILSQLRKFHFSCVNFEPVPLTYTSFTEVVNEKNAPLVIVHGLFGQKQNWNSVGKALNRKLECPIYAIDARNHGNSPHVATMSYQEMAEDLASFVDKVREETGKNKVNLLGHSMGGKIVMKMSMEPMWCDKIEKLIVEDVSPKGYSRKHVELREIIKAMRGVNLNRTRKEIMIDLETIIPDLAMRQFIVTNLQPSTKNRGVMEWKCNIDAIDRYVEDILGHSITLNSYNGPTLFLHGEVSGYVPDDHKPYILELFPKAVFEAIPGAGHWVHAEKPELFINSVVKYLKN